MKDGVLLAVVVIEKVETVCALGQWWFIGLVLCGCTTRYMIV